MRCHHSTTLGGARSVPNLTELAIKAAKPGSVLWDSSLKGFGLRCGAQRKTFIVLIGSGRRQSLGHWPLLGLAEARQLAKTMLAEKQLGRVRPQRSPWADAVRGFLADAEKRNRPRTVRDYRRLLSKHFDFGRTSVTDITAKDILKRLAPLKDTPSERHHAFTACRAFLKWAVQNHLIDRSPMENMAVPKNGASRERVLADDELRDLLRCVRTHETPFKCIVHLLILTGQRRSEIAALQWGWITDDTITLPASVTKNGRTHTFPIGPAVKDVLKDIPRLSDIYVFPAAREQKKGKPATVFNGWGKPKAALDKEMADHLRQGSKVIEPWTLHDLRRTFATNMQRLGVRLEVTEAILNHVSGTRAGVAGIYSRYDWHAEAREALLKWESHLTSLAAPG